MTSYSKIVEDSITKEQGRVFDLIRYCVSDKVPVNLLEVLNQKSPVEYAETISKSHGTRIYDLFENKSLSKDLKEGWVFDKLIEAGCLLRIAEIRKTKIRDTHSLLKSIIPYTLIVKTSNEHVGRYTGLIDFEQNAKSAFEGITIRRHAKSMGSVDRLIQNVGSIEKSSFFLLNSLWKETLSKKDLGFFIFRTFLHAVLLSHTFTNDACEELLEVSRETILKDIDYFNYLIEDNDTTQKDIFSFLNQIEHYITDIPSNILAYTAFTRDFSDFRESHYKVFGDKFLSCKKNDLPEELDRSEWKFLRDLGDHCAPELILGATESPVEHTDYILDNHYKEIYESPFIDLVKRNNLPVPNTFSLSDKLTKSIFKDKVYQSLILRRFLDFRSDDPDLAHLYVKDKSYILLVIEDQESNTRGLSIVSECLKYYLTTMKKTFWEREYYLIEDLIRSWDDLKFFKPNRMDKTWKTVLACFRHGC